MLLFRAKIIDVSISPRVATLRDLRSFARANGVTETARMAGLPTSTLSGWLGRRSVPERSLSRAETALKNVIRAERNFEREVRQLRREFKNLEKLNNIPQFAKAANRQTRTIERWKTELKTNPTPDLLRRIKAGFARADNSAAIVSEKDKLIRDKNGNVIGTRGREVVYDAIRPPPGVAADSYRIAGVDASGNVRWSTPAADDYEGAIDEAIEVSEAYATEKIVIILTYYNN